MERHVANADEMRSEAARFAATLARGSDDATVVTLSGVLGAGKTTFVQGLAEYFGVTDAVTSPTFIIQKRYPLANVPFKNLIHVDAYRLKGPGELEKLEWEELVRDPANVIAIEWPEKVAAVIPPRAIRASFTTLDGEARSIRYEQ